MGHYRYLVYTNPVEGKEDAYNSWYDNVHLGEVIALPGFVAAERYRFRSRGCGDCAHQYLAIYEFETDDPDAVLDNLAACAGDGTIDMQPVLADGIETRLYDVITPRVMR